MWKRTLSAGGLGGGFWRRADGLGEDPAGRIMGGTLGDPPGCGRPSLGAFLGEGGSGVVDVVEWENPGAWTFRLGSIRLVFEEASWEVPLRRLTELAHWVPSTRPLEKHLYKLD